MKSYLDKREQIRRDRIKSALETPVNTSFKQTGGEDPYVEQRANRDYSYLQGLPRKEQRQQGRIIAQEEKASVDAQMLPTFDMPQRKTPYSKRTIQKNIKDHGVPFETFTDQMGRKMVNYGLIPTEKDLQRMRNNRSKRNRGSI